MSESDIDFESLLEVETIVGPSLSTFTPEIPEKSKGLYEKRYKQFKLWCKRKNAKFVTEKVLLSYLTEKSKTLKSSSLWSTYSSLKTMLNIKEGLNIKKYTKIASFLKKKSLGYSAQTSKVLTREQIKTFLEEADDEKYLMWKVVLIMGIVGGLRCIELTKTTIDDVQDRNDVLIVTIRDKNVDNSRIFTITNQDYIRIYRKYSSLRPKRVKSRRLFLKYYDGTCFPILVGVHTIGKIPSYIANYLKLPNVNDYTGHCFRISSAALQANNDVSKMDLERWCEVDDTKLNDTKLNDTKLNETKLNDTKHIEITNNSFYNCRFCLKLPQDAPFRSLSTINSDYVQLVLPEIDLTLTESPRICLDCLKNLENAYSFKAKCLEAETKIKVINEENNRIREGVGYNMFSTGNKLTNENDASNEKIEHFIQPKIEVIEVNVDVEEELNENEILPDSFQTTMTPSLSESIYEDNYNVTEPVNAIDQNLLPAKSRERYEKAYHVFDCWCKGKDIDKITEGVLMAYFEEQAKSVKPSSLWSLFSMLKSTIIQTHNVNIGGFSRLIAFLKTKNVGFISKKTKYFTRGEVDKFLMEAPDREFLMMKVAVIVGLAGSCGCDELTKICLDDIDDKEDILILKIPPINATDKPRNFVVLKGDEGINISLYRKYLALRPSHTPHGRLFVAYRNGKCSVQPVGQHTFGKIAAKVASYLELPEPELYTARSLRRISSKKV